jgi:hypothetical protein
MTGEKWVRAWAVIMLFLIVPMTGMVNYLIDPYSIFKDDKVYEGQFDSRFQKIQYLKENNSKYNSYMMSSSRIGTTSPKAIEQYIPGSSFYNFWLGAANLDDVLIHLEYFLKYNYDVKNVYLQIGIHNMNSMNYDDRAHPEVTDESLYLFYLKHLLTFSFDAIKRKVLPIKDNVNLIQMPIEVGTFSFFNRDSLIKNNHAEYIKSEKSFKENNGRRKQSFTEKVKFEMVLSKINILCSENKIKLITFITPHHKVMMDSYKVDDYLDFLRTLAKHNDFYDFSGYNSITMNDYNYYEKSHYLPKIGELISARIFNDTRIDIPHDFGRLVTRENIDDYLDVKKNKLREYDSLKVLN